MRIVKKIIIGIFIAVFFCIAVVMSILLLNTNKEYRVSQFGDTSLIIIRDDIASAKYEEGDLVLVDKKTISKINVGDEIFVFKVEEDTVSIELGFVGEVHTEEDAISMENGATYSSKFIAGEATKVYKDVGVIISILQSTWVFFFVIVVPCFLIFIYQIYALIIEIKFGSDEEPVKNKNSKKVYESDQW